MTKAERHEAIRERAREAIRNLYHNATPHYPSVDDKQADAFQSWFEGAAEFEIEYLRDGGTYGRNYRRTLEAPCNAGRFKSETARAYYVRKGMRDMREERARCNRRDSRAHPTNAMWECIGDFGELYTYGRGGRTLAPSDLMRRYGVSKHVDESYFDERTIADVVDGIRIIESFNRYVESWCASVPEMWREYQLEALDDNAVLSET